jgi:hypothetical protein
MSLLLQFYFKLSVYGAVVLLLKYEISVIDTCFIVYDGFWRLQCNKKQATQKGEDKVWLQLRILDLLCKLLVFCLFLRGGGQA